MSGGKKHLYSLIKFFKPFGHGLAEFQ